MAFVVFYPILIIITLSAISSSAENEKNVCKTPDCYISSEMLKMSMNSTVDPCHNFYEYACGNFPLYKKDKISDKWSEYDWSVELKDNLTARVKEFLNSTEIKTYDLRALEKMQLFHKSCLNTTNMDSVADETIKEIMSELGLESLQYLGLSDTLNGRKFDWFKGASKIKKVFGIDFLITTKIVRNETNAAQLQISNPDSCTPPFLETRRNGKNLVSPDKVFESEKFIKYVMNISKIFLDIYEKPVPIRSRASKFFGENEIRALANFTMQRIDICEKSSGMRNILTALQNDSIQSTHEKMSLKSLKEETRTSFSADNGDKLLFDWETYLSTLFEGIDGITVNDELDLYVEKHVLSQVTKLLNETSTETLALALWFDAFTFMIPFTTSELRNLDYSVKKELDMTVTTWDNDMCTSLLKKYFGVVLMYHFLNDPGVLDGKKRAEQMVVDLKYALHEVIGKSEWMDNQTRVEAENKIAKMKPWISHLSWLSNRTLLDLYYENYTIEEENFLISLIGILRENVRKNLALLESPVERFELEGKLSPLNVNGYYSNDLNLIIVPFGIMHRPFFGHPLAALNYGGLGTVIGHEVTHGFDTTGSVYDENGQQRNWWKKETKKKFDENTKCFENAYNNISVKFILFGHHSTKNVDGLRTLDENIADNGGMREVLIAYRKYVSSHGEEPFLVGFENFSHEQLLTLSFANIWCTHSPLAPFLIDEHAPNEARVKGVFMNSEEISQIWSCPKGSPMNPEKKCRIW